jgi:serine/threonine protein kinase
MQLYTAGNLANLLQTTTLADVQKKELVRGILEGLQYLHAQKRIHRDFKPANILIAQLPNGNYRPLIADFGLTKIVGQNDYLEGSDVQLSDGRGTASYKAPEQIAGETAHYNLDLWAFGVILYEITTGDRPFKRGSTGTDQQRDNELYRQIQNVALPPQLNTIAQPYLPHQRHTPTGTQRRRIAGIVGGE